MSVSVSLTDSNEVIALKEQVAALTADLSDLQSKYNHLEYLYRCEVLVNSELTDLCRAHGVSIRRSLHDRPRE